MKIRNIKINNYRGIKHLDWNPNPEINCLIGPGDSTKTTILDAIEMVFSGSSGGFLSVFDTDFFGCNVSNPVEIFLTVGDLDDTLLDEDKYGLHARGFTGHSTIVDEPETGSELVLTILFSFDENLEAAWSIYNDRLAESSSEFPRFRKSDRDKWFPTRLGAYAEEHLTWGRRSALSKIDRKCRPENVRLADAARAAQRAYSDFEGIDPLQETADTARNLADQFSVPNNGDFSASLDMSRISIKSGGVSLHDGGLPLNSLGTGSSRLLVASLQQAISTNSNISLIDEIEYGLEPHRLARLLKHLKDNGEKGVTGQAFITTHSPEAIRELVLEDINIVRAKDGFTRVLSAGEVEHTDKIQALLRASPSAFLAPKVLVGEGRTECGLMRGFDEYWVRNKLNSFALQGVVPIDGGGKDDTPLRADMLVELGYSVAMLLDSDEPPNEDALKSAEEKGAKLIQWSEGLSTEERLFIDAPWDLVKSLVCCAGEIRGSEQSIIDNINNVTKKMKIGEIDLIDLPKKFDTLNYRRAIGKAAKSKGWFKTISYGELVAELCGPYLKQMEKTDFGKNIAVLRQWIDG